MMSEGTKLGVSDEVDSFSQEADLADSAAFSGTKIGEVSAFEKSLYDEGIISQTVAPKVEVKENVVATSVFTSEVTEEPVAKVAITKDQSERNDLQNHLEKSILNYQQGDIISGTVRKIEKSGILVDIGYKSDGYIPNMEFSQTIGETPSNTIKEGDEVQAYIVKLETKEGYTLLSRKRAEYETAWNLLGRIAKTKEQIEIQVTSNVEGGLVVDYKGIKGFIPASHVLKTAEEKLEGFLNTTLSVVVIQVERKRRKVIFSHKLARIKPDKVDLDKVIDKIEVGEVYSGVVSSIKDFGAFVNIGGAEGLVHISELSWSRVNHPSEMLKVGDNVQVFVLGVDREHNKISLGMKQLQPDPWVNVMERFKIGQVVKGKITRLVSFGAFIQLEKDVEGLIHISELSYDHIEKAEEAVKPGQEVTAKIIKLLPDEQKIGLTLKGIDQNSAVAEIASVEEPTV
jgi:ribosomal protein S1